jgi:hypothetical protein
MFTATLLASSLLAAQLHAETDSKPLTNADVAAMAQGGLDETTIISAIQQRLALDVQSLTARLGVRHRHNGHRVGGATGLLVLQGGLEFRQLRFDSAACRGRGFIARSRG